MRGGFGAAALRRRRFALSAWASFASRSEEALRGGLSAGGMTYGVRRGVQAVKSRRDGLGLHAAPGVGYSPASPFAAIAQW
jgi:hypothetical protein